MTVAPLLRRRLLAPAAGAFAAAPRHGRARHCSVRSGRHTLLHSTIGRASVAEGAASADDDGADSLQPSTSGRGGSTGRSPIYSRPELYDAAFSYRKYPAEVKFLQAAYRKHGGGDKLGGVLDLGCGPARHILGLAQAGASPAVGLDASDDMLEYARTIVAPPTAAGSSGSKAGAAGRRAKSSATGFASVPAPAPAPLPQAVQLIKGDMESFDLPHKSFDMVTCLLGTLSHLLENKQAVACFRCAAKHLRPGGLFLLELAHPGDLFDGSLIIEDVKEVWEVPYKDNKIFVEWGTALDEFNPCTQILYRTITINVLKGEEVLDSVEEVVPYRQFTVRELELMADMSGFGVEALYGEMDLGVGMDHEEAYRMVAVCRKL